MSVKAPKRKKVGRPELSVSGRPRGPHTALGTAGSPSCSCPRWCAWRRTFGCVRPSSSVRAPENVQRPVGVCVTSTVEAVAHCLARGGRHRSHTAQAGEGRLALLEPLRIVSDGNQHRGRRVGTHAPERDEGGHGLRDQPRDLFVELNDLLGEPPVRTSNGPHRQLGRATGRSLGLPGRKHAAVASSLAVERPRSCALSSSGALRSSARSWLAACVRALIADRRTTCRVRTISLRDRRRSWAPRWQCSPAQRPGGGLGVGGVVLTEAAPVLAVRAVHLDDLYTSLARRKRANPAPKLPLPSMPARSNVPNSSTQATNAV